jgi:hypothetical protein
MLSITTTILALYLVGTLPLPKLAFLTAIVALLAWHSKHIRTL